MEDKLAHPSHPSHPPAVVGAHPHGHPPVGRVTEVLSGLIIGVVIFVYACVFVELVFGGDPALEPILPAGVGMMTVTAAVGGLFAARYSDVGVSISGPHVYPTLVFASCAQQIAAVCREDGLPTSILPTLTFTMAASTLCLALCFLAMGHYRLARVAQYLPAPLLAGFVACIGYKAVKAALQTAVGPPWASATPSPPPLASQCNDPAFGIRRPGLCALSRGPAP